MEHLMFEIIPRKTNYMHSIQHDVLELYALRPTVWHPLNVIDPIAEVMMLIDLSLIERNGEKKNENINWYDGCARTRFAPDFSFL